MNLKTSLFAVLTLLCAATAVRAEKVAIKQETNAKMQVGERTFGEVKLRAGQTFEVLSKGADAYTLRYTPVASITVPAAACEVVAPETPPAASVAAEVPGAPPAPAPPPQARASNNPNDQFSLNKGEGATAASAATNKKVPNSTWKLVWSDEFDKSEIDGSKWEFEVNGKGGGNNERQYYTDRPKNAKISNGRLVITAEKEDFTGPDGKRNYTSSRLKTKGKGDWKYGRMEASIKIPKGEGLWPAFWMMPTEAVYGGWARSGEIDIMENVGKEPDTIYGTLHYGGGWPKNQHTGDKVKVPGSSSSFHLYAVEWEEGEIRWYVDNKLYQVQNRETKQPGGWSGWFTESQKPFPAPFDQKFFIILNVAVGGQWPGDPKPGTKFPQTMEVEYVRVYQP